MRKPIAALPTWPIWIILALAIVALLLLSPVARAQIGEQVVDANGVVLAVDVPPSFTIACEATWVERSNGPTGRSFTRRYSVDVENERWWIFDSNPRWETIAISGGFLDHIQSDTAEFYRMSVDLLSGRLEIRFDIGGTTGRAEGACEEVAFAPPPEF